MSEKTRTYHGRIGAERRTVQNGTPRGLFAQETTDPLALQGIADNCITRG